MSMDTSTLQEQVQQAHQAYQRKQYKPAAELFQQAADEYAQQDELVKAAEMRNNASVAWLLAGQAEQALEAARDTHLVFSQSGDDTQTGMAYGNQAAAYEALQQYEQALAMYRLAADHLSAGGEKEYRAVVLKQISQLQLKTGDHLQALASMNSALQSADKLTGKEKFLQRLLKQIFH